MALLDFFKGFLKTIISSFTAFGQNQLTNKVTFANVLDRKTGLDERGNYRGIIKFMAHLKRA